jgi:hypothetical protein
MFIKNALVVKVTNTVNIHRRRSSYIAELPNVSSSHIIGLVEQLEAVFEKICDAEITDYNFPWHELMSQARQALDEVSRR